MKLLAYKKAQAENFIVIPIFLVMFGFVSIIAHVIMSNFVTAYTNAGLYTGTLQETGDKFLAAIQLYDTILVVMMVMLIIAVVITSFRIRTSPLFFILTLITATFTGFVSFFFNYIFIQLVSNTVFTATIALFPKTMIINTNLHWVTLIALVAGSIALYGKKPAQFANE